MNIPDKKKLVSYFSGTGLLKIKSADNECPLSSNDVLILLLSDVPVKYSKIFERYYLAYGLIYIDESVFRELLEHGLVYIEKETQPEIQAFNDDMAVLTPEGRGKALRLAESGKYSQNIISYGPEFTWLNRIKINMLMILHESVVLKRGFITHRFRKSYLFTGEGRGLQKFKMPYYLEQSLITDGFWKSSGQVDERHEAWELTKQGNQLALAIKKRLEVKQ